MHTCYTHLHSTMVRLKQKLFEYRKALLTDLHSTMVRLKRVFLLSHRQLNSRFTFHYGKIKTTL